MEIVLIVGLFCALIFFMNHEKSNPPIQSPPQPPLSLPNGNQNEIEELRNILSDKDGEIQRLKNELREKENTIYLLNNSSLELMALKKELQRFKGSFPDNRNETLILRNKNEALNSMNIRLTNVLHEKEAEIARLSSTPKTNYGNEIQRLNVILSDKDREITRLLSIEDEYVNEIQRLNKIIYDKGIEKEIKRLLSR